jgi:hypothetical protein
MSYELRVDDPPGYLHVRVTGANTSEVLASYLEEVLQICASRRCTALLIEENLAGPELPLAEIYRIVRKSSESPLAHLVKVAFVNLNPAHPDANMTFGETVARNRGVNARAFRSVHEAQAWLREVPAAGEGADRAG